MFVLIPGLIVSSCALFLYLMFPNVAINISFLLHCSAPGEQGSERVGYLVCLCHMMSTNSPRAAVLKRLLSLLMVSPDGPDETSPFRILFLTLPPGPGQLTNSLLNPTIQGSKSPPRFPPPI